MNLTIEEQRKLTEFLGECWHEYNPNYDQGNSCSKCGKTVFHRFHRTFPQNLDFTDWRVVGRLIEKLRDMGEDVDDLRDAIRTRIFWGSPQEAICRAILAYLDR